MYGGVATMSRLLKIVGLFWIKALKRDLYSAKSPTKETYILQRDLQFQGAY